MAGRRHCIYLVECRWPAGTHLRVLGQKREPIRRCGSLSRSVQLTVVPASGTERRHGVVTRRQRFDEA